MDEKNIYELWETLISRKSTGTARNYNDALQRFSKDNGLSVQYDDITPEFVDGWRKKMFATLSRTTVNIYLRCFSAILHYAFELHLIDTPPKFLFRGLGIYSRSASNSRRHCYLPISEWRKLWRFFNSNGRGYTCCKRWRNDYRKKYMEAVGLMLFMYLAGGMNLRDMCMLRYDSFFFQSGKKQLQFCRHKTAERTNATVELPILAEMQIILDRLGNTPKEGELMFPYLNGVVGDDEQEHNQTALLGHAIRDRMKTLAKALGMVCVPTPTWARHSFATNLVQAGVPKDYVSWAMAHSSNSTTSLYIAAYSYEQTVEYHNLLLYSRGTLEHFLSLFNAFPEEERKVILSQLQEKDD